MEKGKYRLTELIFLFYVTYGVLTCVIPTISNILSQYIMIVNFLVSIYFFAIHIQLYHKKKTVLLGIALINLVAGTLINDTGYGSLLTIATLYLLFMYAEKIKIRPHCMTISTIIVLIGGAIFLFIDKTSYNTNTVGYLYFVMTIFLVLIYNNIKNKKNILVKLVFMTLMLLNMMYIYQSDSRASLMGLFVFLGLMLCSKIVKNKLVFKVLTLAIIIGTILFPYIYVGLYQHGINVDISYSDKKFYSGRQVIWSDMMEAFKNHELYGLGSNYRVAKYENTLNVHNSLFAIYMIYGGLNFCIFLPLFIHFIWKMYENIKNKTNAIAIFGIIGMIVVSYFETNLIWGDVYMFFVLLSCIAYQNTVPEVNQAEKKELLLEQEK